MDGFIIMCIALFIVIRNLNKSPDTNSSAVVLLDNKVDMTERTAKLNDSYYKDEKAFSEIINALGFPK